MGNAADARIALLERLFDHAPLFPPASLPLAEAIREDERARESSSAFALGRFVSPASRLRELPDFGRGLSVFLDGPFEHDVAIEALEAPPEADVGALSHLPDEVYVEVRLGDELEAELDRVAALRGRAKVRCGGATSPSDEALARFLRRCRERGIAYKATAGLHHAVRRDGAHGFLNLLAASVFEDEEAALAEADPGSFALDAAAFSWRGRSAGVVELAQARRERLHSIGTCSFFEPIEELEALGILPL